jgi:hypothetical protein
MARKQQSSGKGAHNHNVGRFRVVIGCEWDLSERKKSLIKTALITIATSTASGVLVKILYNLYLTGGTHGIRQIFT